MWLDDLNELVGTLKERIEQHKDVLGKNETATRYALIDPLLTGLGWDLSDPGQVRTEYRPDDNSDRRRRDYTMFTGEDNAGGDKKKPQLVIEAKHLGTPIGDKIIDQTIGYCVREGIPYFAVTNGSDWEIYKTFGEPHIRIEDRRIVDFKLTAPAQTTVMKMLWLWRGNFESESPIVPVAPDRPVLQQAATSAPQPAAAAPPSTVERPDRSIPLDEFNPSKGPPPAALLFSDGTKKSIAKWHEIQTSVVEWLIDTSRLTEADCPVKGPGGRHLVVTSPFKRNDNPFQRPKQIGSFFIDAMGRADLKRAKEILIAWKVDLSDVRVVERT